MTLDSRFRENDRGKLAHKNGTIFVTFGIINKERNKQKNEIKNN